METFLTPENSLIISKLGLAMVFGMIIGIERIIAHKTAGMRTYALVAAGSALFVIISDMVGTLYANNPNFNPTQIAGQIVTGIGFLGAGLIIFKDSKITGLTTATSIWVSAGIGMACGFGLTDLAIIATALVLFVFIVLYFIEQQIRKIPKVLNNHPPEHDDTTLGD